MLLDRLRQLESDIRVGIIGAGSMGAGLFHQCMITPGIRCVAVADVEVAKATDCVKSRGIGYQVVHTTDAMGEAVAEGLVAVCRDARLLAGCQSMDVVIESSSAIGEAGQYVVSTLRNGKHVIMMNSEADLTFGPYLMHVASENGVVYTSCDGDQHGVIQHLVDEVRLWGFDLVMAGNIKGFLDRYANPTTIVPEADKRRLDYRMATAYTDGTKLCVEMALLANALDLSTRVPGMLGARAERVEDVFEVFDLDALWSDREACVDYVLGAEPDGGVFAIGYCDDVYQRKMLAYYKMGEGPYYLFYRPYHLCHIEAMKTVAAAFLDGRSLLQPLFGFRANVYAYAKRDLEAGDVLDGIGGYTCYGLIENCEEGIAPLGLPICLADGVVLEGAVSKDERIPLCRVSYDPQRIDYALYAKAVECSGGHLP